MILGIGIDLCAVSRMAQALEKPGFTAKYCTETEQAYLLEKGAGAAQTLAGLFAAKEAALKALGCGIALPLREVGIVHDERGAPRYALSGQALMRMQARGGRTMHLSITHDGGMAAAVAVWEGDG